MATVKDTLILEDKMSQTIKAVSNALEQAQTNAKIARTELADLENKQKEWLTTLQACRKANDFTSKSFEEAQKQYNTTTQEVDKARLALLKYEGQVISNENKMSKLNTKSIAFGSILGNIGANLAMRAFDGLKNSIGTAIQTASDLAEVQNVVDVSFGQSSAVIDKWSQTTLNKFGLNELSAKKFAGTMGAMLKSSGLTGDSVLEMSQKITELTGDMASFHNLGAEEAFMKLRSGISGETEPLKQLGINMSVANLKAFALSQGITKSYNSMSQAEQMTLRYNYLLKATADSHGYFERTIGSFANQRKLANENWLTLSSAIANYVIPALTLGYKIVNNLINFIIDRVIPTLEFLTPTIIGVTSVIIASHIPAILLLIKNYTLLGLGALKTGASMAFAWAMANLPLTITIALVGGLIAIFTHLITTNQKVAKTFYSIINAIDGAFTAFKKWRNRNDEVMVNKIEADYQARVAERQKRIENIGNKSSINKSNPLENALNKFSTGGALKTKQQGAIELKEEDIKMLNELATRDFMVRYQSLSPQVTFGNVTVNETADFNQVLGQLDTWVAEKADSSLSVGIGK